MKKLLILAIMMGLLASPLFSDRVISKEITDIEYGTGGAKDVFDTWVLLATVKVSVSETIDYVLLKAKAEILINPTPASRNVAVMIFRNEKVPVGVSDVARIPSGSLSSNLIIVAVDENPEIGDNVYSLYAICAPLGGTTRKPAQVGETYIEALF